jgi:7-cyano-7-deazaguanine synthase in queuosine biosynthesis
MRKIIMSGYPVNWQRPFSEEEREKSEPVMVIYSGGMDSTVLCADLKAQGKTVIPIIMDNDSWQYEHVIKPAILLNMINLDLTRNMIVARFPLLSGVVYSQDYYKFMPGLTQLFWTIAMSYAQPMGITKIYAGYINDNHVGGYTDETQEYIDKVVALFNETYIKEPNNTIKSKEMQGFTPYRDFKKSDVVLRGSHLGVNLGITRTCMSSDALGAIHCGECQGCRRRRLGFIVAQYQDEELLGKRLTIVDNTKYQKILSKSELLEKDEELYPFYSLYDTHDIETVRPSPIVFNTDRLFRENKRSQ